MINQEYCNNSSLLNIFFFIKSVMDIIKIAVPILLIVMSMIDVVRVVISTDKDNKILSKKTIDRFISAIFVFLVVSVMDVVLNLFGGQSIGLTSCWTGANEKTIASLRDKEKIANQKKIEAEKELIASKNDFNGQPNLKLRDKLYKASSFSSSNSNNGPTSDGSLTQAAGKCVQNNVIRNKQVIVDEALKYVGNPYVWGGTSLTNGADCSGFVQQIFAKFGASTGRVTTEQAFDGSPVASIAEAEVGDIILYHFPSTHVAIYMGNNKIVHASNSAPYPQGGIKVSDNAQYSPISAIRRIIC